RTVLVSSHLMTEMSKVADHLIVISRGRLLARTSTSEFIRRNARTHVRVRTSEPLRLRQALERKGASLSPAHDGSLEVDGLTAVEINRLAAAGGIPLEELTTRTGSLEDTFLKLTGEEGSTTRV
ncbi:ABC transporter ATP-binding protein, partial [Kitasatospora sp. NPDC036755]